MNTIKRHEEQVNDALNFLGKAKFTNAENLQLVAGRNRRGFPTQLKKLGLVLSREMPGGNSIYGLSKLAADSIGAKLSDIHKVTKGRLDHALIAQYETLVAVKELGVVDYQFEPQEFSRDTRPDVIWVMTDLSEIHVEVELSPKTPGDGDLDKFFLKLLSRKTIVIFYDEAILYRYAKAARQYISKGIPNWQFLGGKWIKFDDLIQFDQYAWDQIEFWIHKSESKVKLSVIFEAIQAG